MIPMSNLENAKVGDQLLVSRPHGSCAIETVERITPTLVITKSHRFVKRTGDAHNMGKWFYTTAQLATPADVERVRRESRRKELATQCGSINFHNLSVTQLAQILEIVNNKTSEQ